MRDGATVAADGDGLGMGLSRETRAGVVLALVVGLVVGAVVGSPVPVTVKSVAAKFRLWLDGAVAPLGLC